MNIVLIGMSGSGKSTVGKLLSEKLGKKFVEMDNEIEKKTKISIPDIVKKFGWDKFRDIESRIVEELASINNVIISTGGGVVIRDENISTLKKKGAIIWLNAKISTLANRIDGDPGRPLFANTSNLKMDVKLILSGRKRLYKKSADLIINTDNKIPEQVAGRIISYLKTEKKL